MHVLDLVLILTHESVGQGQLLDTFSLLALQELVDVEMQLFKFKLFLCFDLVLNGRVLASRGHDERFIMSSDTVPTRRHNHLLRRRTQRLPIHLASRLSHLLTRLIIAAASLTQSCIFVVPGCLNMGQVELCLRL